MDAMYNISWKFSEKEGLNLKLKNDVGLTIKRSKLADLIWTTYRYTVRAVVHTSSMRNIRVPVFLAVGDEGESP